MTATEVERNEGAEEEGKVLAANPEVSPEDLKKEGEKIFGAEKAIKIEELFGQVESLKKALAEKNPDAAIAISKRIKSALDDMGAAVDEKKDNSIWGQVKALPFKKKFMLWSGADPSVATTILFKEPHVKELLGSIKSLVAGSDTSGKGLKELINSPEIQSMFSGGSPEGVAGVSEGSAVAEGAELAEIAETVENLELLVSLA